MGTVTPGHFRVVCKHGTVVTQCRCPHANKGTHVVQTCPTWCTGEAPDAPQTAEEPEGVAQ